jgi:uncharacterized protein
MTLPAVAGYAFNQTRQQYLATRLRSALTHWTRLRGLIGTQARDFPAGSGLWIAPCRGVHTFAMSIPIDVLYLDRENVVLHVEANLQPWRMAPVKAKSRSVLELPANTVLTTGTVCGDKIKIVLDGSAENIAEDGTVEGATV